MESISPELAADLLVQEADRIRMLIRNQKNSLCISQCKAFEEVVDTQMYGLSRQVAFAIRLGIVSNEAGQQLLSDLERDLNKLYNEVYKETKANEVGREG
ncbi:YlaN family protein [Enterococcus olivae]